jgi:manganese-dependent inorganic pyrophosphatase
MERPVYILGHRNPDADAICSALGYAAFKHALGETHFVAARCGNSNARIDTILRRFGVDLPVFIGDVTPRVRDVMVEKVYKVRADSTCAEALELIDEYDIRGLPVVDESNRVQGMLSVFDLGNFFIPKRQQPRQMRFVHARLNDINQSLDGTFVTAREPEAVEEFFVRVGAMDIRSFGRYYTSEEDLAKHSIIIVGDRYDIQQRSIQLGVRALVITGGLPVEDDVVQMAKERGVSIISSPHDSATTSWLIRSSTRVERMAQTDVTCFRPDEKLTRVRPQIQNSNAPIFMVVDDDNHLVGVFSKTDLVNPVKTSLVLVDHNELTQAVTGADKVNILEIVDHHRLGNPPTEQPILFINRPLGSTSTIVADLFHSHGIKPSPEIAGVLMGGVVSDTLNLQGPTTTERDRELLSWLEDIAGCSADSLAEAIFSAGSIILSEAPEDVIRADFKIYHEGEVAFAVSQVEELGYDNFYRHYEALDCALEKVRKEEDLLFAAMLVTDISSQNSLLLVRGDEELVAQFTYPRKEAYDVFELNGIVSRKKQLIPYLTSFLRGTSHFAAV